VKELLASDDTVRLGGAVTKSGQNGHEDLFADGVFLEVGIRENTEIEVTEGGIARL